MSSVTAAVAPADDARYTALLRRLYAYERSGMRLGLDGPRRLHDAVGAPEQAFRAIQLAGTNGKGTASACLAAILRAAGCRTGLFTSPHLIDFPERIRVDGRALPRAEVERLMAIVSPATEDEGASYFETVTALGALAFRDAGVEWAVTEVGMGGRLDATTVWPSLLGGITAIDLDHTEILGRTVEEIAPEKAGIARAGGTVVSAETRDPARGVLQTEIARRGARLLQEGRDWSVTLRSVDGSGATLDLALPDGTRWDGVRTRVLGAHQARNAALAAVLAWAAADARVGEAAVREGLATVRWPGRADLLTVQRPTDGTTLRVLTDVAHNPAAGARLAETLRLVAPAARRLGCVGMLADKDAAGFAAALGPLLDGVVVAAPASGRALPAADLAALFAPHTRVLAVTESIAAAIATLLETATADDLCVVTGSCYTVGESLPALGVEGLGVI